MTLYNTAGQKLNKNGVLALTQAPANADPLIQFTADVFQNYNSDPYSGADFESQSRKLFATGQIVRTSDVVSYFVAATIAAIAPATGPAAGGTAVTITGTDFAGATGATLGGNALTNFKVVSNTKITGTTAAHAAGVVDLVVTDDSGAVTDTGAFTFV